MEYCYPIQLRELQHCIVPVKLEPFMIVTPVSSFLFKRVYMDSYDPDVRYVAIPPYVQIYDENFDIIHKSTLARSENYND